MPDRLFDLQQRFAAHIRNPDLHPAPAGVENRRMRIYRELFFKNLVGFVSKNFPVLRSLYDETAWKALVRDFYTEHRCHTPLFPELPREFLQYLQDGRGERADDPPFLLELAHYEWVELALDLDEQNLDSVPADPGGDLLSGVPVFSPLAWPLAYRFPVHRIRPDFRPQDPPAEPTHLLVYRNRAHAVRFMQLNAMSALLAGALRDNDGARSGRQLLESVATRLQHPDPERVVEKGTVLLGELRERDVILGTRPGGGA